MLCEVCEGMFGGEFDHDKLKQHHCTLPDPERAASQHFDVCKIFWNEFCYKRTRNQLNNDVTADHNGADAEESEDHFAKYKLEKGNVFEGYRFELSFYVTL